MLRDTIEMIVGSILIGLGVVWIISARQRRIAPAIHKAYTPARFVTPGAIRLAWVRIIAWAGIMIVIGTALIVQLNSVGTWLRIGLLVTCTVVYFWAHLRLDLDDSDSTSSRVPSESEQRAPRL